MEPLIYPIIVQREGDIISLPVEECQALVQACKLIEKYNLLNKVNTIFTTGLLSSLSLKDDEFNNLPNIENNYNNLRYSYIVKTGQGKILNQNGYNIFVRAKYNHDDKKQVEYTPTKFISQPKIYISKGGVVTGEFIQDCIIPKEVVDRHRYNLETVPVIPVSIIVRKDETYFVVDHREPKLNILRERYEVPKYTDEKVQAMKMNLRSYTKLNKK